MTELSRHDFRTFTPKYRHAVQAAAVAVDSDHCTGVPDWYRDACDEHDVHYRTHARLDGRPIRRARADWLLGRRIRVLAREGLSWEPWSWQHVIGYVGVSWWRYAVVRLVGRAAWAKGGTRLASQAHALHRAPWAMGVVGLILLTVACTPTLAQRCERLGQVWAEKRGEAGTIIGYECRERR